MTVQSQSLQQSADPALGTLTLFTDASLRGRTMGFAVVAKLDGRTWEFTGSARQFGSNSVLAELLAVRLGLRQVRKGKRARYAVHLVCDCQSVVHAINGSARIKGLDAMVDEIRELLAEFASATVEWRARNRCEASRRADQLAFAAVGESWGRGQR
jgi:ribonuclease HI